MTTTELSNDHWLEIYGIVTKLLASTKSLLESLTQWSVDETKKDTVYTRFKELQFQFDCVCLSFEDVNVDMSDLAPIPEELRQCLEATLCEPPSHLDRYLPKIRIIILDLLHLLKRKQAMLHAPPTPPSPIMPAIANLPAEMAETTSASQSAPSLPPKDDDGMDASPLVTTSLPTTMAKLDQLPIPSTSPLSSENATYLPTFRRISIDSGSSSSSMTTAEIDVKVFEEHEIDTKSMDDPIGTDIETNERHDASPLLMSPTAELLKDAMDASNFIADASTCETMSNDISVPNSPSLPPSPAPEASEVSEAHEAYEAREAHIVHQENNKQKDEKEVPAKSTGRLPPRPIITTPMPPTRAPTRRPVAPESLSSEPPTAINTSVMPQLVFFIQWRDRVKRVCLDQPPTTHADLFHLYETKFGLTFTPATAIGLPSTSNAAPTSSTQAMARDQCFFVVLDPTTNIRYELEDMDDVKPNALLSLDVLPPSTAPSSIEAYVPQLQQALQVQLDAWAARVGDDMATRTNAMVKRRELAKTKQELGTREAQGMIADHGAIQQQANSMADKIEKLQDTLDELKTDVTQRRSRPAPEQMTWCSDTLQEIQDEMRALVATIQTNKATWKRAWEKQLQLIIQEQHAVEEWEHMVVDAEEDIQTMHTIMDHLQQVVTLYQQSGARPSNSSSTSRAYLFSSSPIVSSTPITTSFMNSQRDAMTDVLHQLRTIDVDHDRRVQAVVKSEQRRSKFMAHHIDDFEKELITFQLKNTGGAQQLEQQQEQKTKQLLQDLYNAQKAPPSPSLT